MTTTILILLYVGLILLIGIMPEAAIQIALVTALVFLLGTILFSLVRGVLF